MNFHSAMGPAISAGDAHDAVALFVMACGLKSGSSKTMGQLHSLAAKAFARIFETELAVQHHSRAAYLLGLAVQDMKKEQVRCSSLFLPC